VNKILAALLTGLLCTLCLAADLQAGRDYSLIDPPLATQKNKIEVIEFFSYACPHCKEFHPLISQWAAQLPKDVSFRRAPVTFKRVPWVRLSKIYFALETTGDLAKLDGAVFKALHEDRIKFDSDEAVLAAFQRLGLHLV
jgi:thiol:disulfide interchange protein DsbA